ncbi:MAG: hypothetical protein HQK52_23070 [Oligoflexia bacterium]|nr:hypothetical protein [Oligoflexia bacterium]
MNSINMEAIEIREWESKLLEDGYENLPKKLSKKALQLIDDLSKKDGDFPLINIAPSENGWKIRAFGAIGTIKLDDVIINIVPRTLYGDPVTDSKCDIQKRIITLLIYGNGLDISSKYISRAIEDLSPDLCWFDYLSKLYITQLQAMMRFGFITDYSCYESDEYLIRGQIDFKKLNTRDVSKWVPTPCRFWELDFNTEENRLIKFALNKIIFFVKNNKIKIDALKIDSMMNEVVSSADHVSNRTNGKKYARRNRLYPVVIGLAHLICGRKETPFIYSKNISSHNGAVMFNLYGLFESAMTRLIRDHQNERIINSLPVLTRNNFRAPQKYKMLSSDKKILDKEKVSFRKAKPDATYENDNTKIIIDFKYKPITVSEEKPHRISDADLHQIITYIGTIPKSSVLRPQAYLVYPITNHDWPRDGIFEKWLINKQSLLGLNEIICVGINLAKIADLIFELINQRDGLNSSIKKLEEINE